VWAYIMFRLKTGAPTTTIAEMPKKHTRPKRYAINLHGLLGLKALVVESTTAEATF
jgi:hypothetical protein